MDYLARQNSPVSEDLWKQIDSEAVSTARSILTGRKFLSIFGPLGIGAQSISVDQADALQEVSSDGVQVTKGRKYQELPLLYEDFTLLSRDLESSAKNGYPADLSRAAAAAEALALKEDRLIFYGDEGLGYEGILTAPGIGKLEKKDWSQGENAYADIASAVELLVSRNIYGAYYLAVSPDLYLQMQRLQPGTGLLEVDRVGKLMDGHILRTPVLGKGKAVVLSPEARNIDLVVGQDMAAAYLEQKELNHRFRMMETVLPRIKRAQSIVVLK